MKIRELESLLHQAGFTESRHKGKGSHRKWYHSKLGRPVLLSGGSGSDAKPYQIKEVRKAIAVVKGEVI